MKQIRRQICLSERHVVDTRLNPHQFETKALRQRPNLSMVTQSRENVQMQDQSHLMVTSTLTNTSSRTATISRNDVINLYATDEDEEEQDIDVIGWTQLKQSSTYYKHHDYKYENNGKKTKFNKTQKHSCKDIAPTPCFAPSYVILYVYACLILLIFVDIVTFCVETFVHFFLCLFF